MSSDRSDNTETTEIPLEKIREMKRKACEKLSSLIQAISSPPPDKRSKRSCASFFTYKTLIKSYKFELWAGNEITPRELAVHGWECKARDQVQCIACKQFLCTSVPKITDVDISVYSKCMRRVREKIVNSHVLTCIYRSEPLQFKHDVDEDFLNDVVRPRISSYRRDGLKLNMVIPSDLNLTDEEKECSSSHEAVIGSSLGWSIVTEKLAGKEYFVAVCDYCARDFLLGDVAFDPVKVHQRWCPVLDVNEDDGLALWRVIYSRITPKKYQRTSSAPTLQEAESAKRVLERSLSVISREVLSNS
ncbi:unnamed protein product [Haemonchus placei]|uniref:C3HC-type domain-containing protein n=1 Tax=Haemonchus placei TaxID=6290 RepID=A0A0N4WIJ8_HAEPC|nr:unnamed protein product [Haemonchus placei]